jgi:hypothetical protein
VEVSQNHFNSYIPNTHLIWTSKKLVHGRSTENTPSAPIGMYRLNLSKSKTICINKNNKSKQKERSRN